MKLNPASGESTSLEAFVYFNSSLEAELAVLQCNKSMIRDHVIDVYSINSKTSSK